MNEFSYQFLYQLEVSPYVAQNWVTTPWGHCPHLLFSPMVNPMFSVLLNFGFLSTSYKLVNLLI